MSTQKKRKFSKWEKEGKGNSETLNLFLSYYCVTCEFKKLQEASQNFTQKGVNFPKNGYILEYIFQKSYFKLSFRAILGLYLCKEVNGNHGSDVRNIVSVFFQRFLKSHYFYTTWLKYCLLRSGLT